MGDFAAAGRAAMSLIANGDPRLMDIVTLSLQVSLSAVLIASALGLPFGAALAVSRFPGRRGLIVVTNALMGLPPVVVGLLVYLALSNAGPLGWLQLLYTPTAMIIAQAILITPIIAALSREVLEQLHDEYDEQFRSLCVPPHMGAARCPSTCPLPGTEAPRASTDGL